MKTFLQALRTTGAFFASCLASLAAFGLVLALFQATLWNQQAALRIALALTSAGLGFLAGGYLAARMNPRAPARQALLFGVLFGGFSFGYILGPTWAALLASLLAAALALAGARFPLRRKAISA